MIRDQAGSQLDCGWCARLQCCSYCNVRCSMQLTAFGGNSSPEHAPSMTRAAFTWAVLGGVRGRQRLRDVDLVRRQGRLRRQRQLQRPLPLQVPLSSGCSAHALPGRGASTAFCCSWAKCTNPTDRVVKASYKLVHVPGQGLRAGGAAEGRSRAAVGPRPPVLVRRHRLHHRRTPSASPALLRCTVILWMAHLKYIYYIIYMY